MSRKRHFIVLSAAMATVAWAVACGDGATEPPAPPPDPPRATTVTVSPATTELNALGTTEQLTAEVRDQNGQVMAGASVTWASSSAAVATVSAAGLVTAAGNGTATITAAAGGVSGTATVTVAQTVSAVAIAPVADSLVAGDTLRLAAEATDANGHAVAGVEFAWASEDTMVAVVDATGLVTGVGAGEVEITATASGLAARATLVVAAPAPTTVAVTPDTVRLAALGDTVRLAAEVRDQLGRVMERESAAWASGDTLVATVDSTGLVTAAANGAATITAMAGEASGTAVVTVMQSVASVEVSPSADTIAPGDTLRLAAKATDANGHVVAGAEFAWASGDTAVAVVDATGLVRGIREGTATITVLADGVSGTATVTVSVGSSVTLDSGEGSAPEGGVVTLGLTADPVPEQAIRVRYTLGTDGDPVTTDADGSDYSDAGGGAVEIAAGASGAAIEIAINDDDEIESAREVFTVTLDTPGADAGYGLGVVAAASVTIKEGVCDRTPQVGNEIVQQAGVGDCAQVEDRHLASIQELNLCFPKYEWMWLECERNDPITALRAGDFLSLSGLEELVLAGNDLTALPQGVFSDLSRLASLDLHVNELTALPEGVFSGLSNLENLGLFGNRLTELPAGAFSGLSNLSYLGLDGNGLTELPAGIFAGLSRLSGLDLSSNNLTELPAGAFSGLASLEWVGLSSNNLTELPAGIFAGLSRLSGLDLSGNNLTELPAGVFSGLASLDVLDLKDNPGSPFALTVEVTRTDSGDAMSPGPATLEFRVAEGAPFAMAIPLTVRGGTLSPPSASFAAGATVGTEATLTFDGSGAVSVAFGPVPTVCEDPESNTEGPKCSGLEIVAGGPLVVANPETVALSVPAAHLTQASQDLSGDVPLIAGREALLRVFATADERYIVGHEGRATFFVRGQEVYRASLEPPASGIPIDVEEGRFGHSFNARIPGHVLQPGLEMVVELDPDGALPLKPGSISRFPASGRFAFDLRELPPLNLTIVPVLYHTEARRGTNPVVEEVTRDMAGTDSYGTIGHLRAILPIGDLNVRLREPYYTFADTMVGGDQHLFDEIALLRHLEAGGTNEYYHGIFFHPHRSDWPALGRGDQPGYAAISGIWSDPVHLKNVFAHEFGHNLSLWHAYCGVPPSHPAYTAHADGSIGVWGHRFTDGNGTGFGRLLDPELHGDLMGEDTCPDWRDWGANGTWISDRNFTRALNHRLDLASAPALFAQRAAAQETLLLWGGVHEGDLRLEPAFAHDARLKLPQAPGPYQLEGRDAEGRRLFSFSFTPDALAHGGGSFLFAIPFEPAWTEDLDRITLTGPEGSTTLDRETGGRAAMVIDRASGRVRTIARDWSVGNAAFAAAMASDAQVEVIRGLPRR